MSKLTTSITIIHELSINRIFIISAYLLADENQRKNLLISSISMGTLLPLSFTELFRNPTAWSQNLVTSIFHNPSSQSIPDRLTAADYNEILKHIDIYIARAVDIKLRANPPQASNDGNTINQENIRNLIANILNENLIHYNYQLNDNDIERIAALLKVRLEKELKIPFVLTNDNIVGITKIIETKISGLTLQQQLNLNINYDEIVSRILLSPSLIGLVNQQIDSNSILLNQEKLISEIIIKLDQVQDDLLKTKKDTVKLASGLNSIEMSNTEIKLDIANLKLQTEASIKEIVDDFDAKLASLSLKSDSQFNQINIQIRNDLLKILGYNKENVDYNDIDIQEWIRNTFVAKEFLEDRLNAIKLSVNQNMEEEVQRSAGIVMAKINKKIQEELITVSGSSQRSGTIDEAHIRKIVKDILAIYDADKTGLVDYALETAGGQIISTRCTENYHTKSAQISIFGLPLWYPANTPRIAISPSVQPGECWAFQGFPGYLGLCYVFKFVILVIMIIIYLF